MRYLTVESSTDGNFNSPSSEYISPSLPIRSVSLNNPKLSGCRDHICTQARPIPRQGSRVLPFSPNKMSGRHYRRPSLESYRHLRCPDSDLMKVELPKMSQQGRQSRSWALRECEDHGNEKTFADLYRHPRQDRLRIRRYFWETVLRGRWGYSNLLVACAERGERSWVANRQVGQCYRSFLSPE